MTPAEKARLLALANLEPLCEKREADAKAWYLKVTGAEQAWRAEQARLAECRAARAALERASGEDNLLIAEQTAAAELEACAEALRAAEGARDAIKWDDDMDAAIAADRAKDAATEAHRAALRARRSARRALAYAKDVWREETKPLLGAARAAALKELGL